jgi:hypothetical protein
MARPTQNVLVQIANKIVLQKNVGGSHRCIHILETKLKQTSAYERAYGNSFLRQESSAVGGTHIIDTTITSELYSETVKNFVERFRTKGVEC